MFVYCPLCGRAQKPAFSNPEMLACLGCRKVFRITDIISKHAAEKNRPAPDPIVVDPIIAEELAWFDEGGHGKGGAN